MATVDKRNNYAVFVDLENAGGKVTTLNHIIERVKIRGNILLGKVYGYTDHYSELKEILLSNTFNVVPSIRYGHNQKNNLDIQLVIDALDVAFTNPLIDSYCIVSGDSDYTPLVGKLKSMGKFVLGISRSEVASKIFINACNEFLFLESVSTAGTTIAQTPAPDDEVTSDSAELINVIRTILEEQTDADGCMYASELKNTLLRLRPDFNEKNFGHPSFSKLLYWLESKHGTIKPFHDNNAFKVKLLTETRATQKAKPLTKANWVEIVRVQLKEFKDGGFERINPSILKSAIQNEYPEFDERTLGYKKFSDMLKKLEKDNLVAIDMTDEKTMMIRIK